MGTGPFKYRRGTLPGIAHSRSSKWDWQEDQHHSALLANDGRHPVAPMKNRPPVAKWRHYSSPRDWGRNPLAGEVPGQAPPSCLPLFGKLLRPSQFEILVLLAG